MLNACTIDVEDYFQVSAFEPVVERSQWDRFPARVEANTRVILDILAARNTKATFFVLGWIAEHYPSLVRELRAAGHEVGCHSYEHRLVYSMTPKQFRADLQRAKSTIEQVIGQAVRLFRAPSFSITARSIWAIDILIEEGIGFDSSIFPVRHDRYGISDAPIHPYRLRTPSGELFEFPPSVHRFLGLNLPIGGGGYFRLYPFAVTRHCLHQVNRAGRGMNLYVHPWEFDPGQPRIAGASALARFRHFVRLSSTQAKFERILSSARFGTMSEALREPAAAGLPVYAIDNGKLRRAAADWFATPAAVQPQNLPC